MFRHIVKRFCNATGYCSNGVTITADRNSQSDCAFKIGTFKECNNGLRYGDLACFVKRVGFAY